MEILGKTLDQVTDNLKKNYGKGLFHAEALYKEIFKKGNADFLSTRAFLSSPVFSRQIENKISIQPGRTIETFKEGDLIKFITELHDGSQIESVIIPMANRNTLCVSSQVGCRMGCRFCETGNTGFKRNLVPEEITGQLFNARFTLEMDIKNVVFMGMGEPFDNFDNVFQAIKVMSQQKGFDIALRHITVSTAGLADRIEQLGKMDLKGLRLAISINSAQDTIRSKIMPVNNRYPLQKLKATLLNYPLGKRGCFLFEYILIKGLNDRAEDALYLAEFIKELPVRLNLIAYNPVSGFDYEPPEDKDLHRFSQILTEKGIFVIKRWRKGSSVSAGCGQLGRGLAIDNQNAVSN